MHHTTDNTILSQSICPNYTEDVHEHFLTTGVSNLPDSHYKGRALTDQFLTQMEHYLYFGLAAVTFVLLLLTIGPRHKHRNPLSSTFPGKGFHAEKGNAEKAP